MTIQLRWCPFSGISRWLHEGIAQQTHFLGWVTSLLSASQFSTFCEMQKGEKKFDYEMQSRPRGEITHACTIRERLKSNRCSVILAWSWNAIRRRVGIVNCGNSARTDNQPTQMSYKISPQDRLHSNSFELESSFNQITKSYSFEKYVNHVQNS